MSINKNIKQETHPGMYHHFHKGGKTTSKKTAGGHFYHHQSALNAKQLIPLDEYVKNSSKQSNSERSTEVIKQIQNLIQEWRDYLKENKTNIFRPAHIHRQKKLNTKPTILEQVFKEVQNTEPGQRLKTAKEYAQSLNVKPSIISKTLSILKSTGWIYKPDEPVRNAVWYRTLDRELSPPHAIQKSKTIKKHRKQSKREIQEVKRQFLFDQKELKCGSSIGTSKELAAKYNISECKAGVLLNSLAKEGYIHRESKNSSWFKSFPTPKD